MSNNKCIPIGGVFQYDIIQDKVLAMHPIIDFFEWAVPFKKKYDNTISLIEEII